MDAFELLKADHEKVAKLFDQLEAARGKTKLDVFQEIKSELDLHAHIEETIFYPVLERPEKTHDLTLEAYEEHKVVKTLLAELSAARSANEEWQAKAKVLRENVEHHVEEEENELFKKANSVLSDEETEELGARMEAEKTRKQDRPAVEQPVAKGSKSSRASSSQPGILSKIADFVGLGGSTGSKRAVKKAAAKKKSGTKKAAAKKASTKKGVKSATAAASKRSSTAQGSKRTASRQGGSKKATGASSAKKTAKKKATKTAKKRASRK